MTFADGSVHFINDNIDIDVWRGAASRSGGETLSEF